MANLFGNNSRKTSRIHNPKHQPEMLAHKVKYKNALQLAKDIGQLDKEGQRVFAVVDGSFIFGDFIEAYLVTHNLLAKRMVISTLSLSQNNIDSLKNLFDGDYLEKLDLIVSTMFWGNERGNLINYTYKKLDIDNKFQLAVCRTHTKITLIETECGKWLTIHGSANLRSSDNIEMFSIENSKDLYDFNLEWHDEIINKYQTINKPITNKQIGEIMQWRHQAEAHKGEIEGKQSGITLYQEARLANEQEHKDGQLKSKAW